MIHAQLVKFFFVSKDEVPKALAGFEVHESFSGESIHEVKGGLTEHHHEAHLLEDIEVLLEAIDSVVFHVHVF